MREGVGEGIRKAIASPVVAIYDERQSARGGVRDYSVAKLAQIAIRCVLFRTHHVVLRDAELLIGIPTEAGAVGLARIVVDDIVPAVHEEAGERVLVVEDILGAHSEVVIRNGVGEEDSTRVIPVVLSLDDFSPVGRNELSDVYLQTLANRRQVREVRFL
jgi:hypothetical protein